MNDKTHTINITPYLPGLIEQALAANVDTFQDPVANHGVKLWMLTKMFPMASAGDLLGVIEKTHEFQYSDDGTIATLEPITQEKAS